MELPKVKDLKAIIKLCRATGVKSIKIDNIELTLGDEPLKTSKNAKPYYPGPNETVKEENKISEEELLFWSSGATPAPEEDLLPNTETS